MCVEWVRLGSPHDLQAGRLQQHQHLHRQVPLRAPPQNTIYARSSRTCVVSTSINVKFVGRRYTRRPGAPTVVSGTHDQKVHS